MKNKVTIISIKSYYAHKIFNKEKIYEFRKIKLRDDLINQKLYVYSSKDDKAIIGYIIIDKVLSDSKEELIKRTGYINKPDKESIMNYFKDKNICYAYHIKDAILFKDKLTLEEIKKINCKERMPEYIKSIDEDNLIYNEIINLK